VEEAEGRGELAVDERCGDYRCTHMLEGDEEGGRFH